MAAGDVTLTLAIEGSSTKTITLPSAIRDKSKSRMEMAVDADWAVSQINRWGRLILGEVNVKLESEATWTPAVFTAAT